MSKQNQHKPNVPELCFPEFSGKWEERKLGEVYQVKMGQSPASINYTDNNEDTVLVQGNADLKGGKISPRIFTKEVTKVADKNDILLTVRAPVGKLAIAQYKVCIGRGVCSINGNRFLYNYLQKFQNQNKWMKFSQGSTFEAISGKDIRNILIAIPNKDEQQKIGDFFSKLDRQIELEEKKLALLEEQKKGYMQKIFSQELRFKDENGNEYPEWEEKKLNWIVDVRDGTHESPKPVESGFKLVTSKNLKSGKLDMYDTYFISKEDFNKVNERSLVETNDILFGMIGTIGNPVIIENAGFAIKNVALIKTSKLSQPYFILAYLKSEYVDRYFHKYNTGGTQKFISLEAIRNIPIFLPSLKE